MTTSVYNAVSKTKSLSELRGYLLSINLTLFDKLFSDTEEYSGDAPLYIVKYIVTAYSEDSPYLIAHADNHREKRDICERLKMPDYIADWVLTLSKPEIRSCIVQYIKHFAGEQWRVLQFSKIQLRDIEEMITDKKFVDDKQLFDIKAHAEAIKEASKLAKIIDAIEKEIKSRSATIHIATEEVKKARRRAGSGANMENSDYIS